MIQVGELCDDADFAQAFTIKRSSGVFALGGYQSTVATIPASGTIQPANAKELLQIPEGDRVMGAIVVFSQSPIYPTNTTGVSDIVVWHGVDHRVYQVMDQSDWGYYKAIAARMPGL